MTGFKRFIEETEEEEDVKRTLGKLPKSHAALVKGYKWRFQPGNILKGDDQHIGMINDKDKTIQIAAPWNFSREFTVLHELGHLVWERFVPEDMKKEWDGIAKRTKQNAEKLPSLNQNPEELFCMAYSASYAKHIPVAFHHPEWDAFVKKVPC